METLAIIAEIAGYSITCITLITLIIKPLREKVISVITKQEQAKKQDETLTELRDTIKDIRVLLEKQDEEINTLKDALQCSIRNTITHLYYKYTADGFIPPLEKENINFLFEAYKRTGGNSYVASCVEELQKLPMK